MVPWNRNTSWNTTLTWDSSASSGQSRTSRPPTRTAPALTSYSRGSNRASVLLPDPLAPTRAVSRPASARNDTPSNASRSP